jgi:23S rRNA (guanosine2251-2'-O)-methyltransferase
LECYNFKIRRVKKIFIEKNSKIKNNFKPELVNFVDKNFFTKKFSQLGIAHQNIAAEIEPMKKLNLLNELENNKIIKTVCLNGITDPRNIGSIIRTSVAFGYKSMIINKREFDETNIPMNKVATGGIDMMKIFTFSNIKHGIKILKDFDFQVISLSEKSSDNISNIKVKDNHLLILGSEESGIQRTVLELSDLKLKIEINKSIGSLNVSNACSAAMAVLNYKQIT